MAENASVPIAGNRFLIVGGASLVGSATAAELLDHGAAEVALFDNFAFGSEEAVAHLRDHPRLRLIRGDVLRLPDLLRAAEGAAGVLLLAAYMTLSMDRDPWGGLDVNVRGVQNALEACRANRCRKAVFASSNAVYGYGPGVSGESGGDHALPQPGAPPAAILLRREQDHRRAALPGFPPQARARLRRVALLHRVRRAAALPRRQRPLHHRDHGPCASWRGAPGVRRRGRDQALRLRRRPRPRQPHGLRERGDGRGGEHSGPEPITTLELVRLVTELAGGGPAPRFVGEEPGKVRLTSGGAFRIAHEEAERAIGWRPEVGMREGLTRLIAWRDGNEGGTGR
jgi:UDP-glucose 4-epimerase